MGVVYFESTVILVFCDIISVTFKIELFCFLFFSSHSFFYCLSLHKQGGSELVSGVYFLKKKTSKIVCIDNYSLNIATVVKCES